MHKPSDIGDIILTMHELTKTNLADSTEKRMFLNACEKFLEDMGKYDLSSPALLVTQSFLNRAKEFLVKTRVCVTHSHLYWRPTREKRCLS